MGQREREKNRWEERMERHAAGTDDRGQLNY
jgi:hypothetical protein